MGQLDRRTLLRTGGVVTAAALTGCSDTKKADGLTAAAPDWNSFARSLKGRLFRPGQTGYAASHQLFNPRWDAVQPAGGYVNYVEAGRPVGSYYGASLARLQAVKKKYDQSNFFHAPYTLV